MVNLEIYRIFKVVAEEENLTKASEILYISQPAVTKHIKNLENELHVQLFKRSKYGMILNENGKKLYSQIKDAIDVILKAEDIFNMHSNINLGVHVNMPSKIYNSAILKFYDDHQNSIINIHQLTAENMFSMLEKQKIDIVFSKKYSDEIYNSKEIKFIKIGELHDVFIVNANSQYLNKKLSKKDLRNTTIYTLKKFSSAYQNLIKELVKQKMKPQYLTKIDDIFEVVSKNVRTNYKMQDLLSHLDLIQKVDITCIGSYQLPGESKYFRADGQADTLWWYLYDEEETRNLINSVFLPKTEQEWEAYKTEHGEEIASGDAGFGTISEMHRNSKSNQSSTKAEGVEDMSGTSQSSSKSSSSATVIDEG